MYLKIKKTELVPDKHGKHLAITMIGLYDDNDKYVRWIKLDEQRLLDLLKESIIPCGEWPELSKNTEK